MKKVISILAILVMIGCLCTGCKKKDTDKPELDAAKQSQESKAADWEPETAKQPTADDDHDHNHDDGDGHKH